MALTGHLSDLSLSELIEFFCNQRKSGRLKVLYPQGAGYFYLQAGSVVDARIGVLHGIDAVYYALTLPNAEFEFNAEVESVERTINQPWTQVVLEGLRRLDEGIVPGVAFPDGFVPNADDVIANASTVNAQEEVHRSYVPSFFHLGEKDSLTKRKPLFIGAVAVAVLGSVAVIGVPAGWYHHSKVTAAATDNATATPAAPQNAAAETVNTTKSETTESTSQTEDPAALAAKRLREKERIKAREGKTTADNQSGQIAAAPAPATKAGAKRVVVSVTYDESGRVTQASGGDATALRIARQKRFPAGKAGSTTVTIPLN